MHRLSGISAGISLVAGLSLAAPLLAAAQDATPAATALPPGVEVVVSGLTNPRGFTWDADGALYLALAGTGGDLEGIMDDGTPFGLYGGENASVVRVENGCAVPVAEKLPSTLWRDVGWIWGAMDVAVLDGQLYELSSGGGIEGGFPNIPNGVFKVNDDGSTTLVADLSAWFRANPTAFIPPDYGNDGSLFELEAGDGVLWVSEAVGGRLLTVSPAGEVTLVADLSEDHRVPTGFTLGADGDAYIGYLTAAPYTDGSATVLHVAADGAVTDHWTGLTAMTGLTTSPDGVLYATEIAANNTDEAPFIQPGTGRIVRQSGPDSLEVIASGLTYPVGLEAGPDGFLYVAYPAWGPDAGVGQGALLRLDPAQAPFALAGLDSLPPSCAEASTTGSEVVIEDFAYGPATLEVPAGTTVTWTNLDVAPHTVTATAGFDSGLLNEGGSFNHTFDAAGDYAYRCAYHPMLASVKVT